MAKFTFQIHFKLYISINPQLIKKKKFYTINIFNAIVVNTLNSVKNIHNIYSQITQILSSEVIKILLITMFHVMNLLIARRNANGVDEKMNLVY